MFRELIAHVSLADGVALAIFVVGWFGYGYYADYAVKDARGLRAATNNHRLQWARQMVRRENRKPAATDPKRRPGFQTGK